jgi:resuscitation-promoting factor RpfA
MAFISICRACEGSGVHYDGVVCPECGGEARVQEWERSFSFTPQVARRRKVAGVIMFILIVVLTGLLSDPANASYRYPTNVQWECIHKYEAPAWAGGWEANTGNGYYGGLQFNSQFEMNYGKEFKKKYNGHAHKWPKRVQIIVANRGHRLQGWGAWPQTSRKCGYR